MTDAPATYDDLSAFVKYEKLLGIIGEKHLRFGPVGRGDINDIAALRNDRTPVSIKLGS